MSQVAKNPLDLIRKALYRKNRNRVESTPISIDGYNKESMSDMSEVRESSRVIKSNFFVEQKELETKTSISTPSHTPTK